LFYVAPRVFFVVSFAFKPRTNLAMNFGRLLSAKVRDLTAMIVWLNPGKRLKINSRDFGIKPQRDSRAVFRVCGTGQTRRNREQA
jgi:hypothetical protein